MTGTFGQTVSTLLSFILAMANHPEIQAKAQVELDTVVGPDRLPEFSDRSNLPYINAIISELLRWQPVTPMGASLPLYPSHRDDNVFLAYRASTRYDG